MKSARRALEPGSSFKVLETHDGVQTAVMRLKHGQESGPFGNEHPASVQALFVIRGELDAQIGDERFWMREGDSLIVRRGVAHRFIGASPDDAIMLNVYVPPAYNGEAPGKGVDEAQQTLELEN